jgi:hypothetical protein
MAIRGGEALHRVSGESARGRCVSVAALAACLAIGCGSRTALSVGPPEEDGVLVGSAPDGGLACPVGPIYLFGVKAVPGTPEQGVLMSFDPDTSTVNPPGLVSCVGPVIPNGLGVDRGGRIYLL